MRPKMNVLVFFTICPKKEDLKIFKFDHSFVSSCLYILFPPPQKKIHGNFITAVFLCHGPLSFPTIEHILPLPPQNLLGHVSG